MEKLLIIPPILFTGYSVGVYATLHNDGGFEFGAARFFKSKWRADEIECKCVHEHETYCAFLKFMCSTVSNWSICTIGGDLN